MREILFRGKNEKGKWFYGCYIHTGVDAPAIVYGDGEQESIVSETLGQYSGLEDKYKTKIFEGDILLLKSTWNNRQFKVPVVFKDGIFEAKGSGLLIHNPDIEVIGNIHGGVE